jgi:hypothetical protein
LRREIEEVEYAMHVNVLEGRYLPINRNELPQDEAGKEAFFRMQVRAARDIILEGNVSLVCLFVEKKHV